MTEIRDAIEQRIEFLKEHPESAAAKPSATAKLESGLKFRITDAGGLSVETDMPPILGGGATAPTPGWLQVAAMASCTATVIAMRAAQVGVELAKLEVSVGTEADARGLLGIDDSIPAGSSAAHMQITLASDKATPDELREIASWAYAHSPVASTIQQGPPIAVEVIVD